MYLKVISMLRLCVCVCVCVCEVLCEGGGREVAEAGHTTTALLASRHDVEPPHLRSSRHTHTHTHTLA